MSLAQQMAELLQFKTHPKEGWGKSFGGSVNNIWSVWGRGYITTNINKYVF